MTSTTSTPALADLETLLAAREWGPVYLESAQYAATPGEQKLVDYEARTTPG